MPVSLAWIYSNFSVINYMYSAPLIEYRRCTKISKSIAAT